MAAGIDPSPPAAHTANAKRWFCEPAMGDCTMGAAKRAMRSLKVILLFGLKVIDDYFACFKRSFAQGTLRLN
jgi:hypothetical protein